MIHGFQYFTEAFVVSQSGDATGLNNLGYPQDSLLFYTSCLYQQGFEGFHMGYAVGHVLGACSWSSWPAPWS